MFEHLTVLSAGLRTYLRLPSRTHLLPLGGPAFPPDEKSFDALKILYVGTFHRRNITDTIHAVARFCQVYGGRIAIQYTLVGFGSGEEVEDIERTIVALEMENHVSYVGAVRYPELSSYFARHNVGLSYVPMTAYYEHQPPIKTFEYLLSGMAVVATATKQNALVIDDENGVLVDDNIEAVFRGLEHIFLHRTRYDSLAIQRAAQKHSWESIVADNLIPYLNSLGSQAMVGHRG